MSRYAVNSCTFVLQNPIHMNDKKQSKPKEYTCNDYRQEMRLLGMRQQLNNTTLSDTERKRLQKEIDLLEHDIGLA